MDQGLRRRRTPKDVAEDAVDALVAGVEDGAGREVAETTGSQVVVSPFWSERAQEEARLVAARPAGLGESTEQTSAESTSTELRLESDRQTGPAESLRPVGPPVVYSPQSGNQFAKASAVPSGSSGNVGPAQREDAQQEGGDDTAMRTGMRPGERRVVEEMKNLLELVFEQNQQLMQQHTIVQSRLDKLEDEAMQSASSGRDREMEGRRSAEVGLDMAPSGFTGWVPPVGESLGRYVPPREKGSLDYFEGLEEGLMMAKGLSRGEAEAANQGGVHPGLLVPSLRLGVSSAPDVQEAVCRAPEPPLIVSPPSRREIPQTEISLGSRVREVSPEPTRMSESRMARVNTTPQGTPIPPGEPPQSPVPTPRHPETETGVGVSASGLVWGSRPRELMFRNVGAEGVATRTAGESGKGFGESVGLTRGREDRSSVMVTPLLPSLPDTHTTSGSKDPYCPGDRVFWTLPVLQGPEMDDAATRASDWLELTHPIMSDLSSCSGVWWSRVIQEAKEWYEAWSQAPAMQKGLITPTPSITLQDPRYRRLESRAFGMLQAAIPESIRDELIANRTLTSVATVFTVLRVLSFWIRFRHPEQP